MKLFKRVWRKLFPKKVTDPVVIRQYVDESGAFDYEQYKEIQTDGNKRKLDQSWVHEDEIAFVSRLITQYVPKASFGICHGTRRGLEQKWFKKHLLCEKVIGTEISDTATNFPDTVQWDFHDQNEEWIGQADFVYTNSYDHSYDPQKSLTAWVETLAPGGVCVIEHTENHRPDKVTKLDPFGITLEYLPYQILDWSQGVFSVRAIVPSPFAKGDIKGINFIIIQNNEMNPLIE